MEVSQPNRVLATPEFKVDRNSYRTEGELTLRRMLGGIRPEISPVLAGVSLAKASRDNAVSNLPRSTPQSLGIRTSRRIDRVCARFAITHGPGERPGLPESAESSKTYPGAI